MTREAPLRAGLSACGGIGPVTLDAARRSTDFDVVAIQDVDGQALLSTGQKYGIDCRHARFEDLLSERLDFVILNGPNHVHARQVRMAAEAGIDCLVQKPMARSGAEGREMIQIAGAGGIRMGVTMLELGSPVNQQIREMIRSGWLGIPTIVQTCFAHDYYLESPPPEDNWRRDPELVGGAAFIQLAVHHIDLVSWFLDSKVREVTALASRGHTVFHDETTLATALYENGAVAHFAAGYAAMGQLVAILGTRGTIQLAGDTLVVKGKDSYRGEVFHYDHPGLETRFAPERLQLLAEPHRDRYEVHGLFARYLAHGEPYPCLAERALDDLKVLDAVYHSVRMRKVVSIED